MKDNNEREKEMEKKHSEKSNDDRDRTDSKLEDKERTDSKQENVFKDKGDLKDEDNEDYEKYDKSEELDEMKEDKRDSSMSFKDSSTIPPIHQAAHNMNTTSNIPPSIPSLSR